MAQVTVRVDTELLERAAAALGISDADYKPGALAARIFREAAGEQERTAVAEGGGGPKRAGRRWESVIVAYANEHGRRWDPAAPRGPRDLLDVSGCLPEGWLVGAKAIQNGVSAAKKISEAANQSSRALENLPYPYKKDDVVAWQIIQRPNAPVGAAYAVTDYDSVLRICSWRQEWEKKNSGR